MDGGMDKPPVISVELNKKRKLQYDLSNLSLPLCKHKFGDRFRSSSLATPEELVKMENSIKEVVIKVIRDPPEELEESDNDSNSVNESCDATMALHLDDEADTDRSPRRIFLQSLPSTSSNTSINSPYRSTLNSCNAKNVKESTNTEQDVSEDVEQLHSESIGRVEPNSGLEEYNECIISELGNNGIEIFDTRLEDSMLYSNDVLPNAFLISSGSWSTGQDTRLDARKPTIDQEFEQYFSMLML